MKNALWLILIFYNCAVLLTDNTDDGREIKIAIKRWACGITVAINVSALKLDKRVATVSYHLRIFQLFYACGIQHDAVRNASAYGLLVCILSLACLTTHDMGYSQPQTNGSENKFTWPTRS